MAPGPSVLLTKDHGRMLGRLSPRVQFGLLSFTLGPIIFRFFEKPLLLSDAWAVEAGSGLGWATLSSSASIYDT